MIKFSEIERIVGGGVISGNDKINIIRVSTDSRDIKNGDLFIPIKGPNFDGHNYIKEAFNKGAVAALTQNIIEPEEDKIIIKVEDTLVALGKIANYYRNNFKIPFVAITGSVGKTSTKEMVAKALSCKYNVLKTSGNFNNEIGLPLTLFNLKKDHTSAVIEMGMSDFGEISRLSKITQPNIAVITNIGLSHIENLGSKQNILKAKMEILDGLSSNGIVVLNGDDSLLKGMKNLLKYKTVFFGMEEGLEYQAYNINTRGENGSSFEIMLNSTEYSVFVPVPGIHNIYNALAAISVANEMNMDLNLVIQSIADYCPEKMRMEILELKNLKVINDTYNASPQSMEAAINVLNDIGNENRKIAILGDMLELGEWSDKAHYDIGKYLTTKKISIIVLVGKNVKNIYKGAIENGFNNENIYNFNKNKEVIEFINESVNENDIILVKGSRGMYMEEIVNHIKYLDEKKVKNI
jgi:UDP-N-acetylmuramoyl-tripeptide--D-alanyl-D-alanine ligase